MRSPVVIEKMNVDQLEELVLQLSHQNTLAETREILLEARAIALRLNRLLEQERSHDVKLRIAAALAALTLVSQSWGKVDLPTTSSPISQAPAIEQVIPSQNSVTDKPVALATAHKITALRRAIIGQESSGDFRLVNPHSGALGYGQVMEFNIKGDGKGWDWEILKQNLTPEQFLSSPDLQLKIIDGKLKQYWETNETGDRTEEEIVRRVAATWYSGRGSLWNDTRPQYTKGHRYPSISEYSRSVYRRYLKQLGSSQEASPEPEVEKPFPAFQLPRFNLLARAGAIVAPSIAPSEQDILASKIVKYMESQGYEIARNPGEINLVYIRNNKRATNRWTDKLVIIKFQGSTPKVVGEWQATTMPGETYIKNNDNRDGAPFIVPGQYKAWRVGTHIGFSEAARGGKGHEALIQRGGAVKVLRDSNRDGIGDIPHEGDFGINLHGTKNQSEFVNNSSAGCLVVGGKGWGMQAIQEVMRIVKSDRRYQENKRFVFPATIIENWRL